MKAIRWGRLGQAGAAMLAWLCSSAGWGVAQTTAAAPPTAAPATETQPTTAQAAEDETLAALLKAGEEFDLDAFIASLNPPTVDEIIASLEPIPTRQQILDDLAHPERQPLPPALSVDVAKQVEDLRKRVEELEHKWVIGDDAHAQEQALDEGIRLVEEELELRTQSGQSQDWHEVVDARQWLAMLKHVRGLPVAGRRQLAASAAAAVDSAFEGLYVSGQYVEAINIEQSRLAIWLRWLPASHPHIATSLNNLAALLKARGALAEAEPLQREALAMARRLFPGDHPNVATHLNTLANILYDRGALAESEALHRSALAMRQRLFPGNHLDVATSLLNLANILHEFGALAESEALYRRSLAIRQRLLPGDHPCVATALNCLANILHTRGALTEAEALYRDALAMFERVFSGAHPDVATTLNNLAIILQDRGALVESEALYRRSLEMTQRLFPADHPDVACSLNNLATFFAGRGALAEAEPLQREALAMARRLFPGDHPRVATCLNNLAGLLDSRGALVEAELLYREALAMHQRLFPTNHWHVANSLSNLANVLVARGNLSEAEELQRAALAMRQRLFPTDHLHVANSLNNLANVLVARGNLSEAEELHRTALEMSRRLCPGDGLNVAAKLKNLALDLRDRGALAEAESLLREALAMYQRFFPSDHPDVTASLHNLANILYARGVLAEAEARYCDAFNMTERVRTLIVGAERERAAFAAKLGLVGLGAAYGRALVAREKPDEALSVLERSRGRALLDLLAREDRDLIAEARAVGDAELTRKLEVALAAEDTARRDVKTTEALLTGRSKEREALGKREDIAPDDKARRLADYDAEIAVLTGRVKDMRRAETDAGAAVLVELRGLFPDAQPMTTDAIRAALRSGEVILSYAWSEDAVLLLVAPRAGEGDVQGHVLADSKDAVKELGKLAAKVRHSLATRPDTDTTTYAMDARRLLDRVFPPEVRGQLQAARRLVVLPDGPLNGIPLEALAEGATADRGASPFPRQAEIVYAASATAYLNRVKVAAEHAASATGIPTVLALGNPLFSRDKPAEPTYPEQGALIAMTAPDGNAAKGGLMRGDVLLSYDGQALASRDALGPAIAAVSQAVQAAERPADQAVKVTYWRDGEMKEAELPPGKLGVQLAASNPAEHLRAMAWAARGEAEKVGEVHALDQYRLFGRELRPLAGTKSEVDVIARLVEAAGGKTVVLTGEQATIGELEGHVAGRRIVHLATHGITGSAERPYDASLALTQPVTPTIEDFGFLTLDHLIRKWRGKLKDCDLVVLSACDTQRGVKVGDSVMALPWGFFYAGAPTVVASLWKVDDTATALLMIRFYENLLGRFDQPRDVPRHRYDPGQALPKAEALREAKHWLRSLTAEQVRALCRQHDLVTPADLARGEPGPVTPAQPSECPFEHPYYWSAFILIGDPQ